MKCNINIINRIKRSQGQINGVLKMIDEGRTCDDLTTQLKAIERSIRKTITLLTIENLAANINKKYQIDINEFKDEIDLILKK